MRGKTHCAIGILTAIQTSLIFKIPISLVDILVSATLLYYPIWINLILWSQISF